ARSQQGGASRTKGKGRWQARSTIRTLPVTAAPVRAERHALHPLVRTYWPASELMGREFMIQVGSRDQIASLRFATMVALLAICFLGGGASRLDVISLLVVQ